MGQSPQRYQYSANKMWKVCNCTQDKMLLLFYNVTPSKLSQRKILLLGITLYHKVQVTENDSK